MSSNLSILEPGARLGPYEILGAIGAGGMGQVYRAHDARLDRDVAIKVASGGFSERFQREARAIAQLNHPNICTIYDVGEDGGVPFIAMELLEGCTLQERIRNGPLAPTEAVEVALQIAAGLEAAHSKGIFHRDIKPANIFLTKHGQAKIMDFGLAKFAALSRPENSQDETLTLAENPLTAAGTAVGTVAFMSPEQARGELLDARSDIFSFGAVLYEMMTGVRAFRGGTLAAQFEAILRHNPPPARSLSPEIPAELDRIGAKALEKDRNLRYQTVAEMRGDLKKVQAGSVAATALPAPAAKRSAWILPVGATGWIWPVGSIVIALVTALAAGVYLKSHSGAPMIRSVAVLPFENLSKDAGQEWFSDGMTEALINELYKVHSLKVISRTSVMRYKTAPKAVKEIAKELNVDGVIQGSALQIGDRVRITAELLDASNDQPLWTSQYDRDIADVFALHSQVARDIAAEIHITLTPDEQQSLKGGRPVDPEVYRLYLKGRYYANQGNQQSIHTGIDYFNQAIEKDPAYAPAHADLSIAWASLASVFDKPTDVMPKAEQEAEKALKLDETLSTAHVAKAGVLLYYEYDWDAAERELKRAIELNPSSADAHDLYGRYFVTLNQFEQGISESRRAHELDPLSLRVYDDLLMNLVVARRYDDAIEESRKAIELNANFANAYMDRGLAFMLLGRFDEAVKALDKAYELDKNPTIRLIRAQVQAAAGNKDLAKRLVKGVEEDAKRGLYVCDYEIAHVYTTLGDNTTAYDWLEKGKVQRCDCLPNLMSEPWMDPLRVDKRYSAFLKHSGMDKAPVAAQ